MAGPYDDPTMAGMDPTLAMTHGMAGFATTPPGLATPTGYDLSASGMNMMGTAYEGGINFAQMGAFTAAPVMAGMGGRIGTVGRVWRAGDVYRPAMSLGKTGWGAGRAFGAARGMGMIGRTAMGVGGAAAMALPPLALAMAATETAIEFGSQATGHWQNQQMGQAIMANAAPLGMQYNQGAAGDFGVHLADTAKSMGTDVSQLNSLVQNMSASGQMTGVRDIKEFKTKFKQVLDGIKEVATLTQGTLEDAQQTFSTLRQQGFYKTADVTAQAIKTEARAAAGGMTSGQMLQVGQAGADMYRQLGMRGRVGSDITGFNAMSVNRAFETGAMDEAAVMEMGGPMAVAGMMSQAPAMVMRSSRQPGFYSMRRMMAASLGEADPVTGARSIDMDRLSAAMGGTRSSYSDAAYRYAGTAEAHEQFAPHGAAMMVAIGTRGTSNIHEGQRKMMKTFGMSRDQALLMMQGVGAQRQGLSAERASQQFARDQAGLRSAEEQGSLGYRMGHWWERTAGVQGFRESARSVGNFFGSGLEDIGRQWDLATKGRGVYTTTEADLGLARQFARGGFDSSVDYPDAAGAAGNIIGGGTNIFKSGVLDMFAGAGTEAGMRARLGDEFGTMASVGMSEIRAAEQRSGRKYVEGKDYHKTEDGKFVLQEDMDHAAKQRRTERTGLKVGDDTRRALYDRHTRTGQYSESTLDDMVREIGLSGARYDGAGGGWQSTIGGEDETDQLRDRARLFAAATDLKILTRYDEDGQPVGNMSWEEFNKNDQKGRQRRMNVQRDVANVLRQSGYDDKKLHGVFGINASSQDLGTALSKEGAKKTLDNAISKLFSAERDSSRSKWNRFGENTLTTYLGRLDDSGAGGQLRETLQKDGKTRGLMSNFLNAIKAGDSKGMSDSHAALMEELGPDSPQGEAMKDIYKRLLEGDTALASSLSGAADDFSRASQGVSYSEVVTQNLKRQENAMGAFIRRKKPTGKFLGSTDKSMENAVMALGDTLTTTDPTKRQNAVEGLMQQIFKDQKMSAEESRGLREMLGSEALVSMGSHIADLSGSDSEARESAVRRILGKGASEDDVSAALSKVGKGKTSEAIALLKKEGMLDTGLFGAAKDEKSVSGSVTEMVEKNTEFVTAVDRFLQQLPEYLTDDNRFSISINLPLGESTPDDDK